jgi:hypothetical protein
MVGLCFFALIVYFLICSYGYDKSNILSMQRKLDDEGVQANSRTCFLTNTSEIGFEFAKRSK